MFLLGGTAFSGKTLLAHLLNQGDVVCLDEPDFHDVRQRHRGIAFLRELFPHRNFAPEPQHSLTYREAVALIEQCENAIHPSTLGMKTAGRVFLEYAKVYRESGYPVICVIRDIRDVLVEAPLPQWIAGEPGLNAEFKSIWAHRDLCDLCIRYEDLVTRPENVFLDLSRLIGRNLAPATNWGAETVHEVMFKLDRHEMLRDGIISRSKVGVWRTADRDFSSETQMTAEAMGYADA